MKLIKRLAALTAAAVMAVSALPASVSADSEVHLTRESIELEVGDSQTIRLAGAEGAIKWQIGNSDVFKYSNGKVTALSEGRAYLCAINNGERYKCLVTVKKSLKGVSAEDSLMYVKAGESRQLTVNTDGKDIRVRIKNSNVCSASCGVIVNGKFPLTVKGKQSGTAILTVYDKNNPKNKFDIKVTVGNISAGGREVKKNTVSVDHYADEVIKWVNIERESAGLPTLTKSDSLCAAAAVRADEVATKFSHTRPDGTSGFTAVKEKGYQGENIATGYTTPEEVMAGWMGSPGHMENILDPKFTKIGVAYNEEHNTWTQVFLG